MKFPKEKWLRKPYSSWLPGPLPENFVVIRVITWPPAECFITGHSSVSLLLSSFHSLSLQSILFLSLRVVSVLFSLHFSLALSFGHLQNFKSSLLLSFQKAFSAIFKKFIFCDFFLLLKSSSDSKTINPLIFRGTSPCSFMKKLTFFRWDSWKITISSKIHVNFRFVSDIFGISKPHAFSRANQSILHLGFTTFERGFQNIPFPNSLKRKLQFPQYWFFRKNHYFLSFSSKFFKHFGK